MNIDKLNNLPLAPTAQSAFAVISEMQLPRHESNEQRLAAMAVALFLVARRFRVSPNKLWELSNNLVNGSAGKQVPEFAAITRYLNEEF